jgi:hypothetical protein
VEGPGIRSADDWHQIGDVALPMRGIDEVYDAFSSAREAEPRHPDALTASPRSLSHGGQARTRRRLLPTDAGRPVEPRERLQRLTARPAAEFVDCSSCTDWSRHSMATGDTSLDVSPRAAANGSRTATCHARPAARQSPCDRRDGAWVELPEEWQPAHTATRSVAPRVLLVDWDSCY